MALPIHEWQEGVEIKWRSPSELECRNQSDCLEAVPNSNCSMYPNAGSNGTRRCICNPGFQWDPKTGTCTKIIKECRKWWTCHKVWYIELYTMTLAVNLSLITSYIS
ncbi:unnamed protein product [Victoria cruziana]